MSILQPDKEKHQKVRAVLMYLNVHRRQDEHEAAACGRVSALVSLFPPNFPLSGGHTNSRLKTDIGISCGVGMKAH